MDWIQEGPPLPRPEAVEVIMRLGDLAQSSHRAKFHQSVGANRSLERHPKEPWASKQEERKRKILSGERCVLMQTDSGEPGPQHHGCTTVQGFGCWLGRGYRSFVFLGKKLDPVPLICGLTCGLTGELLKKSDAPEILMSSFWVDAGTEVFENRHLPQSACALWYFVESPVSLKGIQGCLQHIDCKATRGEEPTILKILPWCDSVCCRGWEAEHRVSQTPLRLGLRV